VNIGNIFTLLEDLYLFVKTGSKAISSFGTPEIFDE